MNIYRFLLSLSKADSAVLLTRHSFLAQTLAPVLEKMKKYIIFIFLLFPVSAYCQDLIGITAINLLFSLSGSKEMPLAQVIGTPITKAEKNKVQRD